MSSDFFYNPEKEFFLKQAGNLGSNKIKWEAAIMIDAFLEVDSYRFHAKIGRCGQDFPPMERISKKTV